MTVSSLRSTHAFNVVLDAEGALASMQYLNSCVTHRFTAAYCFDGNQLRNVLLHDKAGEISPDFLLTVPLKESFCQFALREGIFRTDDSANDTRLDGHKYQGVMSSYTGVALLGNTGELWGTLCHFDMEQHSVADDEFDLLLHAARRLPPYLPG